MYLGLSVHGGGGGEDEVSAAAVGVRVHAGEQVGRAEQVVVVVEHGFSHRLAHGLGWGQFTSSSVMYIMR